MMKKILAVTASLSLALCSALSFCSFSALADDDYDDTPHTFTWFGDTGYYYGLSTSFRSLNSDKESYYSTINSSGLYFPAGSLSTYYSYVSGSLLSDDVSSSILSLYLADNSGLSPYWSYCDDFTINFDLVDSVVSYSGQYTSSSVSSYFSFDLNNAGVYLYFFAPFNYAIDGGTVNVDYDFDVSFLTTSSTTKSASAQLRLVSIPSDVSPDSVLYKSGFFYDSDGNSLSGLIMKSDSYTFSSSVYSGTANLSGEFTFSTSSAYADYNYMVFCLYSPTGYLNLYLDGTSTEIFSINNLTYSYDWYTESDYIADTTSDDTSDDETYCCCNCDYWLEQILASTDSLNTKSDTIISLLESIDSGISGLDFSALGSLDDTSSLDNASAANDTFSTSLTDYNTDSDALMSDMDSNITSLDTTETLGLLTSFSSSIEFFSSLLSLWITAIGSFWLVYVFGLTIALVFFIIGMSRHD